MTTAQDTRADWIRLLRAGTERQLSEAEKARRRAETKRVLAFRDARRSIAPDTTGAYIDEIRRQQSGD